MNEKPLKSLKKQINKIAELERLPSAWESSDYKFWNLRTREILKENLRIDYLHEFNRFDGVYSDTYYDVGLEDEHTSYNLKTFKKELKDKKIFLNNIVKEFKNINQTNIGGIFPGELVKKLPNDIALICSEFNFNLTHQKPIAGMLLLRRMLPLSIVRKFQKLNRETEVKRNGEYLETKALLGKVKKYLSQERTYKEILNYKLLVDSVQHSYVFVPQLTDVGGAAVKMRIFLEDLFS